MTILEIMTKEKAELETKLAHMEKMKAGVEQSITGMKQQIEMKTRAIELLKADPTHVANNLPAWAKTPYQP